MILAWETPVLNENLLNIILFVSLQAIIVNRKLKVSNIPRSTCTLYDKLKNCSNIEFSHRFMDYERNYFSSDCSRTKLCCFK